MIYELWLGSSRVNDILTHSGKWLESGFGASGETYLVGKDKTLRNESRFFIEDKQNYLKVIKKAGVDSVIDIENKNTSFSLTGALGASRNGFFNLREHYKLQAGLGTNLSLEALFDLQYLYTSKFSLGLGTSASYEKFKTEEEVSVSFFKLNLRFSAFYYF